MRLLNAKLHFRVDLPGLYANCKLKKKVEKHKLKNLYELHDRHSSFQTVHCLHFASFNSCYWDSLIMTEIPLDKYGKKDSVHVPSTTPVLVPQLYKQIACAQLSEEWCTVWI